MPVASIAEDDDGWSFLFDEGLVTQLQIDYRFTLLLDGGVLITLDEPFFLANSSAQALVPPGDAVWEVAAALPLFNQSVSRVMARRSGDLQIVFTNGWRIDVPVEASGSYENWQITLPDGRMWIGLPGGGVSEHPPERSDSTRKRLIGAVAASDTAGRRRRQ